MKKKNLIAALAMTFVLGLGATAYAASNNGTQTAGIGHCSRNGSYMSEGFRGSDILTGLLESKGMTADEISAARNSGKSLVDLLKEKGVTDEEIRSYMLEQRTKLIDESVASGKITEAQAQELKERMNENSSACIPGQGSRNNARQKGGCGMY